MWKYAVLICLIANSAWASVGEITAATGPGTIKREENRFDGASVALTVNVSDGSSLVTTAVTSATDGTLSASGGGSIFDINIDGDGDVVGNEVDLTVVGVSSVYTITQSGIYDNKIVASFTGDEQTVDITQSD